MSSLTFSVIVAATRTGGIGNAGGLPWPRLGDDMKLFRTLTTNVVKDTTNEASIKSPPTLNAVIMGRKTWESIPVAHRPLKDRLSIVITSTPAAIPNTESVITAPSFTAAVAAARADARVGHIWIGGVSYLLNSLGSEADHAEY
jgi:dihydrofolate reductase